MASVRSTYFWTFSYVFLSAVFYKLFSDHVYWTLIGLAIRRRGQFIPPGPNRIKESSYLYKQIVVPPDPTACDNSTFDLTGKVALILRGGNCTWLRKAYNMQSVGAVGTMSSIWVWTISHAFHSPASTPRAPCNMLYCVLMLIGC